MTTTTGAASLRPTSPSSTPGAVAGQGATDGALPAPAPEVTSRDNRQPTVRAPGVVELTARGAQPVPGISVEDPEALAERTDVGVLLAVERGGIEIGATEGVSLLAPNGSTFLPIVGGVDEVNGALASLRYRPSGGSDTLVVAVTDYGHGDLDVELTDGVFVELRVG